MTMAGIRLAIQTALQNISGLVVEDTVPDTINTFPFAYVRVKSGTYHLDAGADMTHQFEVVLITGRAAGLSIAQEVLDEYIEESGAKSIPAAIEAAVLSTHAAAIYCRGYDRGSEGIVHNGQTYSGARFSVEVWT